MVDQKMTSFRLVLGTNASGGIGVADPKRLHETAPSTISTPAGIQLAIAPTLFSHLPTFNPTTFSVTAMIEAGHRDGDEVDAVRRPAPATTVRR